LNIEKPDLRQLLRALGAAVRAGAPPDAIRLPGKGLLHRKAEQGAAIAVTDKLGHQAGQLPARFARRPLDSRADRTIHLDHRLAQTLDGQINLLRILRIPLNVFQDVVVWVRKIHPRHFVFDD